MAGLTLCIFLLSCLLGINMSSATFTQHLPRMTFTDKDTAVKRFSLHGNHDLVKIIPQRGRDAVIAVGKRQLVLYDFEKTPVEARVLWDCANTFAPGRSEDCTITVFHEMNGTDQDFVCEARDRETRCCQMDLSSPSPACSSSPKIEKIVQSMRPFVTMRGEPSILVDSGDSADLYVTSYGQQRVGLQRFGKNTVGQSNHDKGQYFLGLMPSRRREHPLQDRVYAFYKEKNRENDPQCHMWTPFVTQVCMADVGGPKNMLQRKWTSQMNAKLLCGNSDTKQLFSELVDVAFVHAARWQDTRVYGLFRNEWGMSAVCVYTIEEIDNVFKTSPFKGSTKANPMDRPRMCVEDSTKLPFETLKMIPNTLEMEQWILPRNMTGPILIDPRHNYSHIHVDSSQHMKNNHQAVLFITLNNGAIHKVIDRGDEILVAAEYQPFNSHVHISIIQQASSRKLFIASERELIRLDVENCGQYGTSCEECVLAKDPYCSWENTHCVPHRRKDTQSVTSVNFDICPSKVKTDQVKSVTVRHGSNYFLQCPVTSRHAEYSWKHRGERTVCRNKDENCLLLIDNIGPQKVGTYMCESRESGYVKVLAKYDLNLKSTALTHRSGWLPWVGLVALLVKSLFC